MVKENPIYKADVTFTRLEGVYRMGISELSSDEEIEGFEDTMSSLLLQVRTVKAIRESYDLQKRKE